MTVWRAFFGDFRQNCVAGQDSSDELKLLQEEEVDGKGYRADVKGYGMDVKGYGVDVKGYSVDVKGYR